MQVDARLRDTPEVLPWIPPGQAIEETTNKFAHKKGSIASKINAEVLAKKKQGSSPERRRRKKGSTFSHVSKASSDSGVGSDHELSQSSRANLRGKILRVFEEEEKGHHRDEGDNTRRDQRRRKKASPDDDTDTDSNDDEEEDRRKRAKRSEEFRTKMSEYLARGGKFGRLADARTPELELDDRNDIEFFDDGEDVGRKQSYERGSVSNRSSFRTPRDGPQHLGLSPRNHLSLNESFSSRLESIPEAWLVFPGEVVSSATSLLSNNSPLVQDRGGKRSVEETSRHLGPTQSRLSRAIPVSLRQGIGSRLQVNQLFTWKH